MVYCVKACHSSYSKLLYLGIYENNVCLISTLNLDCYVIYHPQYAIKGGDTYIKACLTIAIKMVAISGYIMTELASYVR